MSEHTSHSGPGLFAAFVPWIVFWILIGNVDVWTACAIPFAVAGLQALRSVRTGAPPKLLEIGTVVVFAGLTLIAIVGDEVFLDRWIQPLANGCLFLIALASVLVHKPFALQYARDEVPAEIQASPVFLRTTTIITWVWVGAFAVMTISSMIPPIVDGSATMRDQDDALSVVFYWVVPFVVLAGAVLFTKWYPDEVRKRSVGSTGSRSQQGG